MGIHAERKERRVRRDDEVTRQSALECQGGDAEGTILVDLVSVPRIVGGFRDSPGHASFTPVGNLRGDGAFVRLVQQGEGERLHDERWHQVLERTLHIHDMPRRQVTDGHVSERPSRNQCSTGTSSLAIAMKLARRASDASKS